MTILHVKKENGPENGRIKHLTTGLKSCFVGDTRSEDSYIFSIVRK
jgi:hypothetical protein